MSESKEVQSRECVFSLAVVLHVSFKHLVKNVKLYFFYDYIIFFSKKVVTFQIKKTLIVFYQIIFINVNNLLIQIFAPHLLILTFFRFH